MGASTLADNNIELTAYTVPHLHIHIKHKDKLLHIIKLAAICKEP